MVRLLLSTLLMALAMSFTACSGADKKVAQPGSSDGDAATDADTEGSGDQPGDDPASDGGDSGDDDEEPCPDLPGCGD